MARLTNLKNTLGLLPPRLAPARDAEGHSDIAEPWRRWYGLVRWKQLRVRIFVRDLYVCQLCGQSARKHPIADHREPHRGDERRFWDEGNVWTLCKPCHDGAKQAEERRARFA